MKRLLSIGAAAFVVAATPLLSASAMPRAAAQAAVTGSDNAVVLVHGDHAHAWDHTARAGRDRDDAWSRRLRRFRDSFG